jgi:hypothetical protein
MHPISLFEKPFGAVRRFRRVAPSRTEMAAMA